MSANGILQKQQYTHGLKHNVNIAPHSLVPTILHEFHDSKNHEGAICNLGVYEDPIGELNYGRIS